MSVIPMEEPGAVPRIIHFVWVGGHVPKWASDRWNYWMNFLPDCQYRLWTDSTVEKHLPLSHGLSHRIKHPVLLSDFVRIEAVAKFGGIYVDTDFWPLRPLDALLDRPRAWCSTLPTSGPPKEGEPWALTVANAFYGFSAWHPFLSRVWAEALPRLNGRYKKISNLAGPLLWTQLWREDRSQFEILPPSMCYPVPGYEKDQQKHTVESVRARYPDALVWHEFEQSWRPGYRGRLNWRPTDANAV